MLHPVIACQHWEISKWVIPGQSSRPEGPQPEARKGEDRGRRLRQGWASWGQQGMSHQLGGQWFFTFWPLEKPFPNKKCELWINRLTCGFESATASCGICTWMRFLNYHVVVRTGQWTSSNKIRSRLESTHNLVHMMHISCTKWLVTGTTKSRDAKTSWKSPQLDRSDLGDILWKISVGTMH